MSMNSIVELETFDCKGNPSRGGALKSSLLANEDFLLKASVFAHKFSAIPCGKWAGAAECA